MQIISHRGAHKSLPENTIEAFERALEIGVDAIEADVMLAKDGRLVLRHDRLIEKEGKWFYVPELTAEELGRTDLGGGARIPLLETFLERFYGRVPIMLDLKSPSMAEGLFHLLHDRRMLSGIHITSPLQEELVAMARLAPETGRSVVLTALPIGLESWLDRLKTNEVSLFHDALTERVAGILREKKILVRAYPVNVRREAELFESWGIAGVFTDDPEAIGIR